MTNFSVATNEYRGRNGERTEYHACVAWDGHSLDAFFALGALLRRDLAERVR